MNAEECIESRLKLNEFIAAICESDDSTSGAVLNLSCSPTLAKKYGIQPNMKDHSVKFLMRMEYDNIWNTIASRFTETHGFADQFIVTGTSGIGKSLFRFYLIRKWLKGEPSLSKFERIVLNFVNDFYVIERDGLCWEATSACLGLLHCLALLDPCTALSSMQICPAELTIVTTSPYPLLGQCQICCLKQFIKMPSCEIVVLKAWKVEEAKLVITDIDPVLLEKFSYKDNSGNMNCIPRWLTYSAQQWKAKFVDAMHDTKAEVLAEWFVSNTAERSRDGRLPMSLCVIDGEEGWAATRFISDVVTIAVQNWAHVAHTKRGRKFLPQHLLKNPWCRSVVASVVEDWVLKAIGHEGRAITVEGVGEVRMKGLEEYAWSNFMKTPSEPIVVGMTRNVLYKKTIANFGSIQGYALILHDLFLIQTANCHNVVRQKDIQKIADAAKVVDPEVKLHLVYVSPQRVPLSLPSCKKLMESPGIKVHVCKGRMDPDDDFDSFYWERGCW